MKMVKFFLIIALLTVNAAAKPTFDVIADIMHDLLHEANQASHGPTPYVHNAASYTYNGYNRPDHVHAGYGYNQRPHHVASGSVYPNNSPITYYPHNPNAAGYYAPNGAGSYGPNAVYDNQGYYKGPPYVNNPPNGYNYNNAPYGYAHNGY